MVASEQPASSSHTQTVCTELVPASAAARQCAGSQPQVEQKQAFQPMPSFAPFLSVPTRMGLAHLPHPPALSSVCPGHKNC